MVRSVGFGFFWGANYPRYHSKPGLAHKHTISLVKSSSPSTRIFGGEYYGDEGELVYIYMYIFLLYFYIDLPVSCFFEPCSRSYRPASSVVK